MFGGQTIPDFFGEREGENSAAKKGKTFEKNVLDMKRKQMDLGSKVDRRERERLRKRERERKRKERESLKSKFGSL